MTSQRTNEETKHEEPEAAFTKDVWLSAAGRGEWREVSAATMAGVLADVKPTKRVPLSELKDAIKRFNKGEA